METKLLNLIDFDKVESLLDGFNKITGFSTAITDLEGKVLSKSAWSQLCTDFHRVNPETSKNCRISDTELAGKLPEGEKFHCYKCLNGLVDVAAPIVINGLHVANLFSGQFLFEEADRQFFKKQTGKYGFDEKKYLEALEKIPVVSEENVKTAMDFLLNITQMISDITERKLADEKFKMSFMFNPVPQAILSLEGVFIESNQAFAKLIGFSNEEIIGNTAIDMGIFSHEEQDKLASNANASGESIKNALAKFKIRDGSLRDILYSAEPIILNGVPHTLAMGIDVTEQKLAEEQIRFQANLLEAVEQAVIVTNQDGIINYWNPFAEKLYGWFANEVIGRNIVDVNVPQLSQDQASGIMTQLRAGKSWAGEFQVQKRDGTVFTAFVANTPIVNAAGELTAIIGISTDITERKKIENSLKESQKFNETLLNTSPDIIYIYDLVENRNIYSNEGIQRILGYSIDELQEMGNELIPSLMHQEDYEVHLTKTLPLYQTAKDGELIEHEYRMRHKNGEWRWLRSKESVFKRNPDNSPKQIFGIISDITSSKEVQQKLLEEKNKAQQYLEIAEVILLSIDSDGIVQLINPKGCEVLGYTEEEILGQAWYDNFVPERIRKSIKEVVKKIFSGEIESAKYFENEILTKSGEEKLIAWDNSVLKDEKGNIIGTLSSGEDITERKKAEQALIESEEKFRTFSQISPVGIFVTDIEGKTIYYNNKLVEVTGMPVEEGKGAGWIESVHPDDTEMVIKEWYKSTESRAKFDLTYRYKNRQGKITWTIAQSVPMHDTNGKLIGFVGSVVDITSLKQAEDELEKHKKHLEELVNERTKDLEIKISEIERMNKLFVGRELRMKELKGIIKDLEEKLKKT